MEMKQAQAPEASKLPSYMNPAAMNPTKFNEIKEKRKMLWSKPKEVRNDKPTTYISRVFDYILLYIYKG